VRDRGTSGCCLLPFRSPRGACSSHGQGFRVPFTINSTTGPSIRALHNQYRIDTARRSLWHGYAVIGIVPRTRLLSKELTESR
jgi:hypothetical protein